MKKVYITTGTADFLLKLLNKHKKEYMTFMYGEDHALLYHETAGKTVFSVPKRFDIIESSGNIPEKGFAVFHFFPVTVENREVFEYRLQKRPRKLGYAEDFLAMRILRPVKHNTYLIITCWKNKKAFESWKEREKFFAAGEKDLAIEVNKRKMYTDYSYLREYIIGTGDEEESR